MSNEPPVAFRFGLRQNVIIVPIKIEGQILARCDRGEGLHDYRVVYWADSKRNDEWLYEFELTEKKENGK